MHIEFNYREGICISDVRAHNPYQDRERTLFNRISVVEMVVPYGCPDKPHHKKHAFDVGKYGSGFMGNSLKLGCDKMIQNHGGNAKVDFIAIARAWKHFCCAHGVDVRCQRA